MSVPKVVVPTIRFTRHAQLRLRQRFKGCMGELCQVAEQAVRHRKALPITRNRLSIEGKVRGARIRIILAEDPLGALSIITCYRLQNV